MDNRELDRAVATRFLGWQDGGNDWWIDGITLISKSDFQPTEKASSCETVLDEIERRGWAYVLYYEPLNPEPYRFQFSRNDEGFHASAKRREESVCLAVLEAIKAEAEALKLLATETE